MEKTYMSMLLALCGVITACIDGDEMYFYRCSVANDLTDTVYVRVSNYRSHCLYAMPPQKSVIIYQTKTENEEAWLYYYRVDTLSVFADVQCDALLFRAERHHDYEDSKQNKFFCETCDNWTSETEHASAGGDYEFVYRTETFHITPDIVEQK